MRVVPAVVALGCLGGLLGSGTASAYEWKFAYKFYAMSCDAPILTAASGVHDAGDVVTYQFWSTCRVAEHGEPSNDNDEKVRLKYLHSELHGIHIRNVTGDFKVEGKASWTRKSGLARELLAISGAFNGKLSTEKPACPKDPFLAKNPGVCSAGTANVAVNPSTPDFGKLTAAVTKWPREPIFRKSIDLEEAKAFSIKSAQSSSTVPPPPPPKPKTTTTAAKESPATGPVAAGPATAPPPSRGTVRGREAPTMSAAAPRTSVPGRSTSTQPLQVLVEAEQFAAGASVSQGRVTVQAMDRFGSQWSGNKQLFWSGGQVGAVLDVVVDVPQAGLYAVLLRLTKAPDYGDLKFEVDGKASVINFAGYAPNVSIADAPIGTFQLAPGPRKIGIMVTGRQAQSTNFFVGIDRVTLTMLPKGR